MKSIIHTLSVLLLCSTSLLAQVGYNANDTVPPYEEGFLYGTNMGFYNGWNDTMLANIACDTSAMGLGLNSLRPSLPQGFLEQWGYDIRLEQFAHYESVGAVNNTVFIGYPSPDNQDFTEYCPGVPSELFRGMYEPIWDNGENGTPVNEANHYAVYLWKTVTRYKGQVKFWEIWNEPDFDRSGDFNPELEGVAWKPPSDEFNAYEGNWWDNNPHPCHNDLKAPIFHYVRLLRISYDVIKTLDPDAYIALGGIGYPSFLDAVLRNTDHPDNGSVTEEYPHKGGAYFDCLSFHAYPHVDGSLEEWNNDRGRFDYTRNSDAAVDGVIDLKVWMDEILAGYGYDGVTYPKKETIVTETHIPRVQYEHYLGSDESQKNFLIKMSVVAQMNDISQLCVYDLGEKVNQPSHPDVLKSFNSMGLYSNLDYVSYEASTPNLGGLAYKTVAKLLKGYNYDPVRTAALELPPNIRGGAFINEVEEYLYVLWAKVEGDRNEYARATYSFPAILNIPSAVEYGWNSATTNDSIEIAPINIQLTGEPKFIRPNPAAPLPVELLSFGGYRDGSDIRLDWVTAQEENNDYFVLEHSANNTFFLPLDTIDGAGTVNQNTVYNYLDTRPLRGDNYYRLKQVDYDGTYTYSHIVNVEIESEDLFTVRPTHAEDEVHIEFFDYYDKDIEMEVVDVLGRVRLRELLPAGRNAKTIDISNFDTGYYFVKMKVRGVDYFTRKFIKQTL